MTTKPENIINRESFLDSLASKLQRPRRTEATVFSLTKQRQHEIFADASNEELQAYFIQYASQKLAANVISTNSSKLIEQVIDECKRLISVTSSNTVLLTNHEKLVVLLSIEQIKAGDINAVDWNSFADDKCKRDYAAKAQVGIVYADNVFVESGTVVLESSANQGRSISLLPEHTIFIIPASQLKPRVTQVCEELHQRATQGERLPSCINLISGPSSTADIELIKVIGVHGPISATYILVTDI